MITSAKAGTVNLARNCYFLAIKNNFGFFALFLLAESKVLILIYSL